MYTEYMLLQKTIMKIFPHIYSYFFKICIPKLNNNIRLCLKRGWSITNCTLVMRQRFSLWWLHSTECENNTGWNCYKKNKKYFRNINTKSKFMVKCYQVQEKRTNPLFKNVVFCFLNQLSWFFGFFFLQNEPI